jgi:transposase-like protein
MGAPLEVRTDMEAAELRRLARRERDGRVAARLIALANVLDGMSRGAAARAAGMDRQTLRDWVIRFNAVGADGLRDQSRPGRPTRMTEGQQSRRRSRPSCCAAPIRIGTASRLGGLSICAGSPRSGSASATGRAACGGW